MVRAEQARFHRRGAWALSISILHHVNSHTLVTACLVHLQPHVGRRNDRGEEDFVLLSAGGNNSPLELADCLNMGSLFQLDINKQKDFVGLSEGLINFTREYSPDQPVQVGLPKTTRTPLYGEWQAVRGEKTRQAFLEPETNFWFVLVVNNPR